MTSAFVAFAWLFGSQIATQFELLSENLPQGLAQILRDLRATQWGAWMFLRAQEVNLTSATSQVTGYVTAVFGSIVRTAGYLAVLLFASIYLPAQNDRYLQGLQSAGAAEAAPADWRDIRPNRSNPFSDCWLGSQLRWPSSERSPG